MGLGCDKPIYGGAYWLVTVFENIHESVLSFLVLVGLELLAGHLMGLFDVELLL